MALYDGGYYLGHGLYPVLEHFQGVTNSPTEPMVIFILYCCSASQEHVFPEYLQHCRGSGRRSGSRGEWGHTEPAEEQ